MRFKVILKESLRLVAWIGLGLGGLGLGITDSLSAADNARFVEQSVPLIMAPGESRILETEAIRTLSTACQGQEGRLASDRLLLRS